MVSMLESVILKAVNAADEEQLAACKSLILSNGIVNLLLVLFTIVAWTTFCNVTNASEEYFF